MADFQFDPAFIPAPDHRPKLAVAELADGIPAVDLSLPDGDLVRQVGSASRDWGFFLVTNHGVALEKRRRIEAAARMFFRQSLEEKRKVRRDEGRSTGYYDTELTKNVRDWKEVFDLTVADPTVVPASPEPHDGELTHWTNQWPAYPPELREAFEEYVEEVEKLGHKLMELIALSLGLPANRFRGYFKDQTSFIRLNHYPPCSSPHLTLGAGCHKDGGALTVLAQDDVGGLEVKTKRDGEWIRVRPVPNSFVINVGDIIQDLALATLLMRVVPLFSEEDMCNELKLTEENYGSVKRVFVMSEKVLVGNRDYQRWMIEENPPDRVVEIEGSDHMVMISKPLQLWAHLEYIAQHY